MITENYLDEEVAYLLGLTVMVSDTSRVSLGRFLEQQGLADLFPDYQTYEISIDISGMLFAKQLIQQL
jgi:hypothetical protein